jgi:molybdopterin synthase sulfur carrier subunit
MTDSAGRTVSAAGHVTVRYWAAARAAAGVDAEPVPVEEGATLAEVLAEVRSRHGAGSRLAEVLAVCSVLVGDRPVGSRAPEDVRLAAGDTIELLPPFAGG